MNNIDKGILGEDIAAKYLINNGYHIIKRNVRSKMGEIDIIAYDGGVLCFIEVKTRTSTVFGRPSEAVDFRKRKKLKMLSQMFLVNNKLSCDSRFDVVEVLLNKNDKNVNEINLIKDAF